MSTFEEAKQFLSQDLGGTSLYDHLSETLLKVLNERPSNALDVFEHVSSLVKQSSFTPGNEVEGDALQEQQAAGAAKNKQLKWAESASALFRPPEVAEEAPAMQDLVDEANLFEWAGVGFGREETFRLALSMKQLALSNQVEKLRLWGKILGTEADYYVCEGVIGSDPDEFDPELQEGREGVNKYSYFVANGAGGQWTMLPDIDMAQVRAARDVRRFFTGNLNAPVTGYPPFPGQERHLLRAQVARITASTVIVPDGHLVADDEENPLLIRPNDPEEIPERASDELAGLDVWVHKELELNTYGRCTPMPEKLNEDGDPIEDDDAPEQVSALRSLAEDEDKTWGVRLLPGAGGASIGALAVLRNFLWPGAYAIGFGRRHTNVYVGYGLKFSADPYTPPSPPAVQVEYTPKEEEEEFTEMEDVITDPTPPAEEEEEED